MESTTSLDGLNISLGNETDTEVAEALLILAFFLLGYTVVFGVLLFVGSVSIILLVISLVRGHKTFSKYPFYWIVWQIAIVDGLYMLCQVVCIYWIILVTDKPEPWMETLMFVGYLICDICDEAIIYLTLLMAFNRLAIFVVPRLKPYFEKKRLPFLIMATYVAVLIQFLNTLLLSPPKEFSKTKIQFASADGAKALVDIGPYYMILEYWDRAVPMAILIIYIVIYIRIRRQRKLVSSADQARRRKSSRDDKKMLFQAFIIAVCLQFTSGLYFLNFVHDMNPYVMYLLIVVSSLASIVNHTINPLIFLLGNSAIRSLLPWKKAKYSQNSST